jgi:uncharacterized protein (TIGR02466 family)
MMKKENIFVTSVIHGDLKCEYDKDEIVKFIHEEERNNQGRNISNRMGWQSFGYTQDLFPRIFKPIIDEIDKNVLDYYKFIGVEKLVQVKQFWINVNRRNSYNIEHTHPGSVASGTFYLKVPKNSGNIVFCRNDGCENTWEGYPGKGKSVESWSHFSWTPKENQLILFPPWLKHRVDPNITDDEDDSRISIAFNYT